MEESIEKRINEIYQETLKQNFDEKYDILKQFDFILYSKEFIRKRIFG
ncbi:hypothetical protein [Campylobacter jejuni]